MTHEFTSQPIWQEMMSGRPYDGTHPLLLERLKATRRAVEAYNALPADDTEAKHRALSRLLGAIGEHVTVHQPFHCDYGTNITMGHDVFANIGLTVLDEAAVSIGSHVFIGPHVSIYTACHPLDAAERRRGVQWAEAVNIGSDVWIGGGATICPGVSIGDGCVIGAGAVVTRSLPPYSLAVGNPARVIRRLR